MTDLHGITNAQVWAQEWCRIATEIRDRGGDVIDEGWMIGWFANAMQSVTYRTSEEA